MSSLPWASTRPKWAIHPKKKSLSPSPSNVSKDFRHNYDVVKRINSVILSELPLSYDVYFCNGFEQIVLEEIFLANLSP